MSALRSIFVKHDRYVDVVIEVGVIRRFGEKLKGQKCSFWTMGYGKPSPMGFRTQFSVTREEAAQWKWTRSGYDFRDESSWLPLSNLFKNPGT